MRLSALGLAILAFAEELRLLAYHDDAGVCTIGYGHTGREVVPGMVCSVDQAMGWLSADVADAERDVSTLVSLPLTQHQFDALVMFVYNVGCHRFESSTLLKFLNEPEKPAPEVIAAQFLLWTKVKGVENLGLQRRRRIEHALFLS
jgi:lysozyme